MTTLNELKPNTGATRKRRRIGRGMGSGRGKTSGRGHKGQLSRSGASSKRGFEGGQMPLHRRLPKRGFTNAIFRKDYSIVNVGALARLEGVEDGATVGIEDLVRAGVIRKAGRHGLRVLGGGELSKRLHVVAKHFSESAREKIQAAGGQCEVLD